jgi:hypothetical protein
MGIDYDGGMLVGCHGAEFSVLSDCPEHYFDDICLEEGESIEDLDDNEVMEGLGLESYAEYYDADIDCSYVGFPIGNVEVHSEDFEEWLADVKVKASEFEEITGIKAKLIGCQRIW